MELIYALTLKILKKGLLIVSFLFLTAGFVFGQQICELKVSESPSLRGFSLRTTKNEILKILPKTVIPANDKFGISNFTINFFPLPDRYTSFGEDEAANSIDTEKMPAYKGLEYIEFELLDDKVVILTVQYDTSIQWKSLTEFTKRAADTLKLPNNWNFRTSSEQYRPAKIDCNDFSVEAELTGGNTILRLIDLTAPEKYKKRKSAEEEKSKNGFKP